MFKTYRGNDELIKSWLKRASEEYPVQSVNQALQLILARKMTIGTKAPSTCQVKASLIKTKAFNIDESIAENFFKHLTHIELNKHKRATQNRLICSSKDTTISAGVSQALQHPSLRQVTHPTH